MQIGPIPVDLAILFVVLVLAVVVLVLLRARHRAEAPGLPGGSTAGAAGVTPQAAVVVHAIKVDDRDARRRQIKTLSTRLGWREPIWLETTADDPGRAQAVEALTFDPAAVLAFGGDGTARMVGGGLAGSGVPMGLLPAGTGNLLARNLGIPPNRLESSLNIALAGRDRAIDICWAQYRPDADPELISPGPISPEPISPEPTGLEPISPEPTGLEPTGAGVSGPDKTGPDKTGPGVTGPGVTGTDPLDRSRTRGDVERGDVVVPAALDPAEREPFLVMAGLGFDAEMMAGADAALKSRLGWGAYVVSGMRRLRGRRTPVLISVDGGEPVRRKVRAVVVGNCGMLQAGIRLMPEALPDDGWLDVVVLSPRSTLGWLAVARAVITRTSHGTVEHLRCRTIEIRAERPLQAQLDGDPAGESQYLRVTMDPGALVLRVPEPVVR